MLVKLDNPDTAGSLKNHTEAHPDIHKEIETVPKLLTTVLGNKIAMDGRTSGNTAPLKNMATASGLLIEANKAISAIVEMLTLVFSMVIIIAILEPKSAGVVVDEPLNASTSEGDIVTITITFAPKSAEPFMIAIPRNVLVNHSDGNTNPLASLLRTLVVALAEKAD